jgi:hypothetical protein
MGTVLEIKINDGVVRGTVQGGLLVWLGIPYAQPPVFGWSAVEPRMALTFAAVWVIMLAAWYTGRPVLIRSLRLVPAHVWEGLEL